MGKDPDFEFWFYVLLFLLIPVCIFLFLSESICQSANDVADCEMTYVPVEVEIQDE